MLNILNVHFILIDKTNALGFELYAVIAQHDGAGFSMAYLFIDNSKKNNGARTEILTGFFKSLYNQGLNSKTPDFTEPKEFQKDVDNNNNIDQRRAS